MIAIFILLVCVAPTMRIYTNMYKSQQSMIRELQRDHLAHLVHAKITEQLYKRSISLDEIIQNSQLPLSDPELKEKLRQLSYECSYTFVVLDPKSDKKKEEAKKFLCQLMIKMKDVSKELPNTSFKKMIENQDPSETIYDYKIHINHKREGDNHPEEEADETPEQNAQTSNNPIPTPSSVVKNKKVTTKKENK